MRRESCWCCSRGCRWCWLLVVVLLLWPLPLLPLLLLNRRGGEANARQLHASQGCSCCQASFAAGAGAAAAALRLVLPPPVACLPACRRPLAQSFGTCCTRGPRT